MKKISLIIIIFTLTTTCWSQSTLYDMQDGVAIDSAPILNYSLSSNLFIPMIKLNSTFNDFNVLLMKKPYNWRNAKGWAPFYDSKLNNSFKKTSDSTYELYINNPAKEAYFIYNNTNNNYPLGIGVGKNRSDIGGLNGGHSFSETDNNKIVIQEGSQTYKYNVLSVPYLNGGSNYISDSTYSKQLITIYTHIHFAKPIISKIYTDKDMITTRKMNPSFYFYDDEKSGHIEQNLPQKFNRENNFVIVFKHFGGVARQGDFDELDYSIDNSNWYRTPLSNTPSILIEQLKIGGHTLKVRYPSNDADILTYNFEILPN